MEKIPTTVKVRKFIRTDESINQYLFTTKNMTDLYFHDKRIYEKVFGRKHA